MITALYVVAIGAALACPAHVLWRMRRAQPGCAAPKPENVDVLRRRKADVGERLAAAEREPDATPR